MVQLPKALTPLSYPRTYETKENMKNVLIILALHWVFDFVFQTDKMALGKSKSIYWLNTHVSVYCIGVAWMAIFIWQFNDGINSFAFIVYNSALHWVTDYGTSRLNAYLWKKEMRHWFFVSIGFDQLLHYTALLLTYEYLKP